MTKAEQVKVIKAKYDDCLWGYETCMSDLEKLGYSASEADDILVPLRRMNGFKYEGKK